MKQTLFTKYVIPFVQLYSMMIIITIIIDYALHYFDLMSIGRYLGVIGTLVVISSFIYSLRKRKYIEIGSPKKFLVFHEYLTWAGSILLLVHAGIHFNAVLPWLAVLMLLIVVASGLIGKFLLKKASETLKEKKQYLLESGLESEQADKTLFFDSLTVNLMRKWRVVHLPIAFLFAVLSLIHIITILMFSV